jgi:pimeloyl-ACP methyl ester carboxylesterase
MTGRLACIAVLLAATFAIALRAQSPPGVDTAFARFFDARTPAEASAASEQVVAAGVSFDEAFARLRRGRTYATTVARGIVQASYRDESGEYFYTLDVPETYDPARAYQVRVQLHGGVGRIEQNVAPRSGAGGRLAGAEQIYVMPYAWRDAPWWSRRQTANLHAILDLVKRTYNVDENRVVLSGVSDGGTGAYFMAMRDTTPFASFLPLNGFVMVLRNEIAERDGDLFPNNLLNKPLFIVNGGRDPLYPASTIEPYIEHFRKAGVDLEYTPEPNAGHDTSWWPEVKGSFENFVAGHPRRPLPDTLTWESGEVPARAHWLIIDSLAPAGPEDAVMQDLNKRPAAPETDFGIRASGPRVNRVLKGSNAQQLGVASGDLVTAINNQPVGLDVELAEVLRGFPPGRPLLLTVSRGGQPVRLTGRYAPTVLPGEADAMFPPAHASGRVDLVRSGNRVEVKTRGVGAFTLLLSPDQFDFGKPITVVVNGRPLADRTVRRDVKTLLQWAARDNDRTMLFGAELRVDTSR